MARQKRHSTLLENPEPPEAWTPVKPDTGSIPQTEKVILALCMESSQDECTL